MIEQFFARRVRNSIGKIRSPRQDLTFEQLQIYYNAQGKTLNSQFAKTLELLNEEGAYNYVAYLLSDANGISIQVAKFNGTTRVNLIESNEYGYASLIRAAKQVLDRIEVENRTFTQITSKERIEQRMYTPVALREAVINAIVHNDYTRETAPKFEFFDDRFEITSYGGLPEGLTKEEFFAGLSMPRNKELMRVFKDMEMVENLGTGVPRILDFYGQECFLFSDNFIRMSFPAIVENDFIRLNSNEFSRKKLKTVTPKDTESGQKTTQKTTQKILEIIENNKYITQKELAELLGITRDGVTWHLKKMALQNIISREGPDKGGYWKINK
jgi:predicted HTH transcriptional regulator